MYSENLYSPEKELRVSTLRVLCHLEHLNYVSLRSKKVDEQLMDVVVSEENQTGTCYCNVGPFHYPVSSLILYFCSPFDY